MNEMMENSSLTIPVDAEHGALRFSIIVMFLVVVVIVYVVINALLPSAGLNLLGILIAFAITYTLLQQVEKQLKRRWPSGRVVQVDERGVRILVKGAVQKEIDASQPVNALMWRFKIQRRARVPKGWYVVACALEQDGLYVPVYTFMSPQQFDRMKTASHFTLLPSKKELQKPKMERDLRLAGQHRRLHVAEEHRWHDGAEASSEDFERYIAHLQARFPQWMPSN